MLPLTNGIALRPKAAIPGVRLVELTGETIAVDGTPVTGAELRTKLGASADLVLRLSYLDPAERQALVGSQSVPESPAAPEAPRVPIEPDASSRSGIPPRASGRDSVRIGGSVTVAEGEVVNGDAVAIGGSAHVSGEVRGDVVAIGGDVDLGPQAIVSGDVVVVGGRLHRDPAARVGGGVNEIGWGSARFVRTLPSPWSFLAPFALLTQVMRVVVLCLLTVLVVLLGGRYVERVSLRAVAEPLKAGAVGLLAQILFLPLLIITTVLLVVTIVGIPFLLLIPFVLLALVVVALVGFTAVVLHVGQWVVTRLSWTAGPYLTTMIGVLVLLTPLLLARVAALGGILMAPVALALALAGGIIEYLAWTIGFGAVALTRFSKTATTTISPAA